MLLVLAILGATQLVPNWRVTKVFGKSDKAKIEQLNTQLAAQEATRKAAEASAKELANASVVERAKLEAQVRSGQQMALGASRALNAIPAPQRPREVLLAEGFLARASSRLAQAVGALPKEQQEEVEAIVSGMLSDAQAKVDAANRALEAKDREAKALAAERDLLTSEVIPALRATAAAKEAQKQAIESKVGELTQAVAVKAREFVQKEEEAGSATAFAYKLGVVLAAIVAAWLFFAVGVPALTKVMPAGRLKTSLRATAGTVTSPILYHDASRKLKTRTKQ